MPLRKIHMHKGRSSPIDAPPLFIKPEPKAESIAFQKKTHATGIHLAYSPPPNIFFPPICSEFKTESNS